MPLDVEVSTPLCADRCDLVADLVAENARLRGLTEREARVARGLTPEFVPPIPLHSCTQCPSMHPSPLAAAACEDSH